MNKVLKGGGTTTLALLALSFTESSGQLGNEGTDSNPQSPPAASSSDYLFEPLTPRARRQLQENRIVPDLSEESLPMAPTGTVKLEQSENSPVVVRGKIAEEFDKYCIDSASTWFSGTVLVVKDGQTILQKGYGLADRNRGIVNESDTVFELASLSKQFTAAAILLLEQEGKLSTNDPINRFLPNVPDAYKDVTIYHLLTHSGGLPRGGAGRGLNLEAAINDFLSRPPYCAPGEKYSYSNVDYALLAGIVEIAGGKSFEKFCHEKLFSPAGMKSTGFCGEAFVDVPLAMGYSLNGLPGRLANQDPYPPLNQFGYEYRGMGGVLSNVIDIRRWHVALEEGTILNQNSTLKFFKPFLGDYACGWEVFKFEDGRRCIGHGGSVRGFVCKDWWFPDDNAQIIVLSNVDYFNYRWLSDAYRILFNVK